jgi:transposase
VHELDPSQASKPPNLKWANHREALGAWLATQPGLVAELARDELAEVTRLTEAINALAERIGVRVRDVAPALLALSGCGALTAAKLVGETADVTRFRNEAAFARYTGAAPIPAWSGSTLGQVRMTRSGNRRLNMALHTIAFTQIRLGGSGETYYRRRVAEGDSPAKALRCLKRHLCRVVYRHLLAEHNNRTQPSPQQRPDSAEAANRCFANTSAVQGLT